MVFQVHFAPFTSNCSLRLQLQFSVNIHGVSSQLVGFPPFPFLYKDVAARVPAGRVRVAAGPAASPAEPSLLPAPW